MTEKKETNGVVHVNGGYVADEGDGTKVYGLSTFINQSTENGDVTDKSHLESGPISTKQKPPKSRKGLR